MGEVLTEEEVSELLDLEKMFESNGWQIFIRHQTESLEDLRKHSLERSSNMEMFWMLKGSIETYKNLIGYESSIDARKASWQLPVVDDEPNSI
jgi:hypothetical protein